MFGGRKLSILLALTLVLALGTVALAQEEQPSITVNDQEIQDGTVLIERVFATQDGWVVIHRSQNDTFGEDIGFAPVEVGETTNLEVEIDLDMATETLWAMLHVDEGEPGVYEFPGADVPVRLPDGELVNEPFQVTGLDPAPGATPGVTPEVTPDAAPAAVDEAPTPDVAPAVVDQTPTPEITPTPEEVPAGLPVTGGGNSTIVVLLLGLGGLSLLAGLGLNLARRTVK
jgi:hypothetical protein